MKKPQFYQAVWNSADVGMCVTDFEGTYLDVNQACCRIYGYERSELIGANFSVLLPPAEWQHILRQHQAFLQGSHDVAKDTFQVRRKDGTVIDVRKTSARVFDEAGNAFEVATVTDLGEHNALLRAERYQRQLSEAQTAVLAQVVSQTDVHTVLNTVLEHVNALVPCDASSIALLEADGTNPTNDLVRVAAWRNNRREVLAASYQTFCAPLAALKLEQASIQQGAIIVADVHKDSRLKHDGDRGAWIHSFATIPLRVKDVVLGWLWLDAEAKGAFDQATIRALQPFVNAAAIALRNAQLYARSQRELTEKERVQGELARSEAHLRKLLQALPDGFVRLDRLGRYLEVHVPEDFHPVKPAEVLVGKTVDEVLPAPVAAQMRRHLEELFATGEMQKYDYVLELEGQTHHREVRWVQLSDQGAFGLVRDITERKRVEEALEQREALFRSLFESSSLGIALITEAGYFYDVNVAFCELIGYDRQELIGVDPKTITHPDDVALTLKFTDGDRYQLEKRYLNKQGDVLWVLVSATRLQMSAEQPGIIIKHVQDISAQKQLEGDLQASQQWLESIMTTLPDVVLTLAADNTISFSNVKPNNIKPNNTSNTTANNQKLAAQRVPPEDVTWLNVHVGQNFKTLLPPDQRATLLNTFERVRSRGGIAQLEVRLPVSFGAAGAATEGDERWFLVRVRPGKPVSHELVVVMTDISDIKRSTMRLERALVERTTLLKEIHHRVKNNMQVISSLLHLRTQTLNDDEQGQVAKASLRDSRERIQAMALVHEVMYETDHFDAIDFDVYLNKLLRMVMRVNHIGDVRLTLSLEPVTLHIDQAIPCGLIANELLSNALKHAFRINQQDQQPHQEPHEESHEEPREIRVEVAQQGHDVSMRICDNGTGLPATMPTTHLGMTIVESLVTQLEGTLTFTNLEPPEHGLIAAVRFPNTLVTAASSVSA
jgi:PAS domain S-box-containing protein